MFTISCTYMGTHVYSLCSSIFLSNIYTDGNTHESTNRSTFKYTDKCTNLDTYCTTIFSSNEYTIQSTYYNSNKCTFKCTIQYAK